MLESLWILHYRFIVGENVLSADNQQERLEIFSRILRGHTPEFRKKQDMVRP